MADVSVVIPTRNRVHLLTRSLSSVAGQRPSAPTECIVVDDGDPSASYRIREEAERFGAIYLSTGGGRGGGFARNLGISNCREDIVAFLDDDDEWEPSKIALQLPCMENPSTGMSYTAITIVSGNGRRRRSFREPSCCDQYRAIMRENFIGTTSSVIARRSVLDEIGGFDTSLPALQDYDLYIRVLKRYRTGWTREALTRYYAAEIDCKISSSRSGFRTARGLLLEKYRSEPAFRDLRRSFRRIALLKCIRSRRFLLDTVRALLKR